MSQILELTGAKRVVSLLELLARNIVLSLGTNAFEVVPVRLEAVAELT